ncbi:MAG: AbrB/MazE/SpoVT family DNA-binding domain-containing protein [Alphaproteobacteria bacterium]
MYALKLRRIGNSLGVTLPKEAIAKLKVKEGEVLFLTETPDGFRVTPYDKTFERAMKAFERTHAKYRNAFRELAK